MIFDAIANSETTDYEKAQIIAKGINDYREKIIYSVFPDGVPYRELPYFIAALNLVYKDMQAHAKRNNDLDNCIKAAAAAEELTDTLTETISYIKVKGVKNG